jgi:hypothetical protein
MYDDLELVTVGNGAEGTGSKVHIFPVRKQNMPPNPLLSAMSKWTGYQGVPPAIPCNGSS